MPATRADSERSERSRHSPGTVIRCGLTDTMLADLPVSVVFFFARTLDETRLADGLARALAHVPVFAGRLRTRDEALEIVCDDAGVPMTLVDVDEPLGTAIGRVTLPASGFVTHVDADRERWGSYADAVARWEMLLGRPVPQPTQPGRHGKPVLAPAFVAWLMGLPAGWVTDPALGLPRTLALRVLGNGVVPQQAAVALRLLLCPHRWAVN